MLNIFYILSIKIIKLVARSYSHFLNFISHSERILSRLFDIQIDRSSFNSLKKIKFNLSFSPFFLFCSYILLSFFKAIFCGFSSLEIICFLFIWVIRKELFYDLINREINVSLKNVIDFGKYLKSIIGRDLREFFMFFVDLHTVILLVSQNLIAFFKFVKTHYIDANKSQITPNLTLYYPLKTSILSVSLRFMGVLLTVFLLFFLFDLMPTLPLVLKLNILIMVFYVSLTCFYFHVTKSLNHLMKESVLTELCKIFKKYFRIIYPRVILYSKKFYITTKELYLKIKLFCRDIKFFWRDSLKK